MTKVGEVAEIHRYPVKSMLGERVSRAAVGPAGVSGDRAYALIDTESGKVVSVKRPKRWGRMFELTASTNGHGVSAAFADGDSLAIDDPQLESRLSELFGRAVTIATTPPPDATFDELWLRELKNEAGPYFGVEARVEDDEELVDAGQFMSALGNFFNFGAVHLVTTASTRQLSTLEPDADFAPGRFRPNFVVDIAEDGFVETAWQGKSISVGPVIMNVSFTVPRCVMTTLRQGEFAADRRVLRTITEHNSVDVFNTGVLYPCVGVYADVVGEGEIEVGDAVHVVDASA